MRSAGVQTTFGPIVLFVLTFLTGTVGVAMLGLPGCSTSNSTTVPSGSGAAGLPSAPPESSTGSRSREGTSTLGRSSANERGSEAPTSSAGPTVTGTGTGTVTVSVAGTGTRESRPGSGPEAAAGVDVDLVTALCDVLRALDAGQRITASTMFADRVHEDLHVLADDVLAENRPLGARLLRAKSAVEQGIASTSPSLDRDVVALVAVTREALSAVGRLDPGPCSAP